MGMFDPGKHYQRDLASADEIYNLAAQSHVRVSFDMPEYTAEVDALGTFNPGSGAPPVF